MVSDKKFFDPVLYPTCKSLGREWFIKYKKVDWVKGGIAYGKYKGLLNLYNTVEEREKLAAEYIQMIKVGAPLPVYQGARSAPSANLKPAPKAITNIIVCCNRLVTVTAANDSRPATIAQYKSKLKTFQHWLTLTGKTHLAIGGLTDRDAEDFMIYLKVEKGLCNHTYNEYKNLLSRVWRLYKKHITNNPWDEIKSKPNNTKNLESYPKRLREQIKLTLPSFNPQLWFILQFVYYCGIRPQAELRRLKIKHINFNAGLVTVPKEISKNHKERSVNIYHKLLEQLEAAGYHKCNPEYFIFSHKGQPGEKMVSKNTYARMWDDYRKAHSINSCYKLYGSKHTGGKELTKSSSPYIAKEHFGHGSLKTTEHYIGNLKTDELEFLQKNYPEFS